MTRYCIFCFAVFVAMAISCDQVTEQFEIRVQDESVSDGEAGAETAGGQHVRGGDGKVAEPMPSIEAQAVELAASELAVNLRLLEEEDAGKRAELEREMVSLREQRRALFETRVEGE